MTRCVISVLLAAAILAVFALMLRVKNSQIKKLEEKNEELRLLWSEGKMKTAERWREIAMHHLNAAKENKRKVEQYDRVKSDLDDFRDAFEVFKDIAWPGDKSKKTFGDFLTWISERKN